MKNLEKKLNDFKKDSEIILKELILSLNSEQFKELNEAKLELNESWHNECDNIFIVDINVNGLTIDVKGDIKFLAHGNLSVEDNIHIINYILKHIKTEEEKATFMLGDNSINETKINEKIFDEELFEYRIIDRKDFIDELIRWISEAKGNDKVLMKDDLKMLMSVKDDYIFSSISTNDYIYVGCSEFDDTCKELLELNNSVS